MSLREALLHIDGVWVRGLGGAYLTRDPFHGTEVAEVHVADAAQVEEAVSAAQRGQKVWSGLPLYERIRLLRAAGDRVMEDQENIALTIASETSKPIGACRDEVLRVAETLHFSADAAASMHGTTVPLDASRRGTGRSVAFTLRVPYGVVLGIVPFNSPMNLAAHKIGPALAAGNSIIVKPHPQTPLAVEALVRSMEDVGVPPGVVTLLHGGVEVGQQLVSHPGVDLISFTGGLRAAHAITAAAGLKKVLSELGGDGPNVVWNDADLDTAATELARNAFSYAGQSCIGVQRIYVHRDVIEPFQDRMVSATRQLRMGNPTDEGVALGPMIDDAAAERVMTWIQEALADGATLLCGGERDGRFVSPTLLTDVTPTMRVVCQEVFGPVASLIPVDSLDAAVAAINASEFGLQAGVFTEAHRTALAFAHRLQVGGVLINATSNTRVDQQPYGGMKHSGVGREGPRYAAAEMSQERLVVF